MRRGSCTSLTSNDLQPSEERERLVILNLAVLYLVNQSDQHINTLLKEAGLPDVSASMTSIFVFLATKSWKDKYEEEEVM